MLQTMRERVQGIIATVIIVVLCLAFALWGIQYYIGNRGASNAIATVNGIKITKSQFDAAYSRAKQNIMMQTGSIALTQDLQDKLKQTVLQQMINNQVIATQAAKLNLDISSAQISSVLTSIPAFKVNGQFSPSQFQEMLSRMFYSEDQFINDLKQNMLVNQLQTGIINSSFSLPDEITAITKLAKQQRDVSYAIIPLSKFKNVITIPDTDIQKYYQANQLQFAMPEQVSINYIILNVADIKNKVQYSESDLQQFYNSNLASFSHPKSWQISIAFVPLTQNSSMQESKQAEQTITNIAQQAKTGTSLAKLDPAHGKPVWVTSGQLAKAIEPELAKLKSGELSSPIKTTDGIYLIKVLQIKEAATLSYNQAKDQVKKAYVQQKLNQLFDDANQKLSDLVYTNSNSLTPAATQLGLTIQSTNLFTKDGEKIGLLANPKIVSAAFSDSVLRQGYNSDPIEINSGEVLVLRVKDHKPQTIKPLTEVKPIISQTLYNQIAQQKAQELSTKILQALQQGKSFAQVMQEQKLTWKNLYRLDFTTKGLSPELIQAALYLPIPSDKPSYGKVSLKDNTVALIAVNKVYPGEVKQLSVQQIQELKTNIALTFGQIDFNLLTNEYIKNARVKK